MAEPSPEGTEQQWLHSNLSVEIVSGEDLVAKDTKGMFSSKAVSSDPLVKLFLAGKEVGKTQPVMKNLNPEWNEQVLDNYSFQNVNINKFVTDPNLTLKIYDFDKASLNDPMGECVIPLRPLLSHVPWDDWVTVQPCDGCAEATGRLHVRASMSITATGDNTVYLTGFSLCWDDSQQQYYAYNGNTGETIMGVAEDGNATGIDRSLASWKVPYEAQSYPIAGVKPYVTQTGAEAEDLSKIMSHEKAAEKFEKYLDDASRYYYFVDKKSGETLWTKPPKVPLDMMCTDEGYGRAYEGGYEGFNGGGYEGGYDATGGGYDTGYGGEGGYDASGYDAYGASEGYGYDNTEAGGGSGYENWGFANGSGGGGDPLAVTQQAKLAEGAGGGMLPMLGRPASDTNLLATQSFEDSLASTHSSGTEVYLKDERGKEKRGGAIMEYDALKTRGGGGHFDQTYGGFVKNPNRPHTTLPWMARRGHSVPALRFLDAGSLHEGPYCRRTGKGKKVVKAINKLPPASRPVDKVERAKTAAWATRKVFITPKDYDYKAWDLGAAVDVFDENKVTNTTVEPMGLARAAYEDGGRGLINLIEEYSHRPDVLCFALMNLAKLSWPEREDTGEANVVGVEALKWVIRIMALYKTSEAVSCYGMTVLAELTDNFAMRREIMKEDWVARVIVAMSNLQKLTHEIMIKTDNGKEKKLVTEPTRHAIEVCLQCCKIFAQMACDSANRQTVADDGISMVMKAMNFCPEEETVQLYGCRALYNFVYRCEHAHLIAVEDGAYIMVEGVEENFPSDRELVKIAQRTLRALSPDGWRGGADEPRLAAD